jgi:heterodisulfide reductase subunit C
VQIKEIDSSFNAEIESLSNLRLADCYQCGKCSAGCPQAVEMDYGPTKLIRLAQLGLKEKVLTSDTIWFCVSCETCGTRCPKEFDPAHLINSLREMAISQGYDKNIAPEILHFHRSFLEEIEGKGRVSEFSLVGKYKLRSGHLFQDLDIAPQMILKGKLKLLPPKVKNKAAVEKIFKKINKGPHK